MSFRLDGEVDLVPCRDAVKGISRLRLESADDAVGLCLVTGKRRRLPEFTATSDQQGFKEIRLISEEFRL